MAARTYDHIKLPATVSVDPDSGEVYVTIETFRLATGLRDDVMNDYPEEEVEQDATLVDSLMLLTPGLHSHVLRLGEDKAS